VETKYADTTWIEAVVPLKQMMKSTCIAWCVKSNFSPSAKGVFWGGEVGDRGAVHENQECG
jgi:hypothetical protein